MKADLYIKDIFCFELFFCKQSEIALLYSFIINLYYLMQAQQNLAVLQGAHQENEETVALPNYDFSESKRIKKLTTHDIYRFKNQNVPLVVKLFAPQALKNYEQEVNYLTRMSHPQILKVQYKRSSLNPNACEPIERCHLIVLKEAIRGDLNDYLPRFGRMTQKMARTLFVQLIEGLKAASKLTPAIIHPNLQASSILLGQSGQLYICGWSQITAKSQQTLLQQCIFSCGEILICLVTSFMPFYKKYSINDEFYKFITPEHIHKFWEQLQKSMCRVDKTFKFQPLFKALVEKIFLKKIKTLQQILNEEWTKGQIYNSNDLVMQLEQNQKLKKQKLEAKKKLDIDNQQKRKKALRDFQLTYGLQRSSQNEHEQFIKDYQINVIKEEELPSGKCNIKIEGSPGFIVASLLEFLREQNGKISIMVSQQFVLSNHKIVKSKNYIIIELVFSVSLLEEEQDELLNPTAPIDSVSLKLKLSFFKSQQQFYADIEAVESNFNVYYTNVALRFLQQKIQQKKQTLKANFKKN